MGRREQKKLEKRARLQHEGLRLFLEAGYDRTSIEQIAAASSVARGTFYLYFPDKRALFDALMDRWYEPALQLFESVHARIGEARAGEDALRIYQEMGLRLATLGVVHRDEILLSFREGRRAGEAGERLRERELKLLQEVTAFTETASRRGLIRVEDPRLTVLVIFGAVERLYYELMIGSEVGDPSAVADVVVRLFGKTMGLGVER